MELLKEINLDELIEKVVNEKIEITINLEPDRAEIKIEPWQPFAYSCPYGKAGTL